MPELSRFFGIKVMMNPIQKEHNPPHVHVWYSGIEASFRIQDGEIHKGNFPSAQAKQVKEWILLHQDELFLAWETQTFPKISPLE